MVVGFEDLPLRCRSASLQVYFSGKWEPGGGGGRALSTR